LAAVVGTCQTIVAVSWLLAAAFSGDGHVLAISSGAHLFRTRVVVVAEQIGHTGAEGVVCLWVNAAIGRARVICAGVEVVAVRNGDTAGAVCHLMEASVAKCAAAVFGAVDAVITVCVRQAASFDGLVGTAGFRNTSIRCAWIGVVAGEVVAPGRTRIFIRLLSIRSRGALAVAAGGRITVWVSRGGSVCSQIAVRGACVCDGIGQLGLGPALRAAAERESGAQRQTEP